MGRASAAKPTIEGANVVEFPREWFGPLEELVPFGPSAAADASGEHDFWGEDSAALQGAVEAPASVAGGDPTPRASVAGGHHQPRLLRRRLAAVGSVLLAMAVAGAAVLVEQSSPNNGFHKLTFAVVSIPPLAPAAKPAHQHAQAPTQTRRGRRSTATTATAASTPTRPSSPSGAPTQPASAASQPSYHPAPASPSSAAHSGGSQSGGAFTLGGP